MIRHSFAIALAALFLAVSAPASEHATTTAAWGDFLVQSWSASGASPDVWIPWQHDTGDGPVYDVTFDSYSFVRGTYAMRCAPDTLAFAGNWDEREYYFAFHNIELQAELGCTVEVAAPVRLTMTRDLPAPLSAEEHAVTVTDADGQVVTYLGPDPVDTVEIDLEPGVYDLRILVDVYYYDTDQLDWLPPYDGAVTVTWCDILVAVESTSLSRIKELFR